MSDQEWLQWKASNCALGRQTTSIYTTIASAVTNATNALFGNDVRICKFLSYTRGQEYSKRPDLVSYEFTCTYDNHDLRFSFTLPLDSTMFTSGPPPFPYNVRSFNSFTSRLTLAPAALQAGPPSVPMGFPLQRQQPTTLMAFTASLTSLNLQSFDSYKQCLFASSVTVAAAGRAHLHLVNHVLLTETRH